MNKILVSAAPVLLFAVIGSAGASNPVDAFNSANAALLPSLAVDRQSSATASKGPVGALIRMVPGQHKATEAEPAQRPEFEKQPARTGEPHG